MARGRSVMIITFRADERLLNEIDRVREKMSRVAGKSVSRSSVIRAAISIGLRELDRVIPGDEVERY